MNKITRSKDLMIPKVTTGPISASTRSTPRPRATPTCACRSARSRSPRARPRKPSASTTRPAPTPTRTPPSTSRRACPASARPWVRERGGVEDYVRPRHQAGGQRQRLGQAPGPRFPQQARALARPARQARDPIRVRQGRHHHQGDDLRRPPREPGPLRRARPRQGRRGRRRELRRRHPRAHHAGVRARRDRPRPRHHPGQHQPRRAGADDHRPQLPGEDQRQHRQLRRHLLRRGGGGEDGVGDPLGRRHRHGPLHRPQHPQHPRVDPAQLAGADRHRADLPGAGEVRRRSRQAHLGDLSRHADRAGRAGRRLLHHPRRRAPRLRAAHRQPQDRHRLPRRLDHGQVVPRPSQGELPLRALRGDLRSDAQVRRLLLAGRRPAPRLDRRRQRRARSSPSWRRWAS